MLNVKVLIVMGVAAIALLDVAPSTLAGVELTRDAALAISGGCPQCEVSYTCGTECTSDAGCQGETHKFCDDLADAKYDCKTSSLDQYCEPDPERAEVDGCGVKRKNGQCNGTCIRSKCCNGGEPDSYHDCLKTYVKEGSDACVVDPD